MNRTERLFDIDPKLCTFRATVLSCRMNGEASFDIVLDKTAFFPNEGGQACDTGTISGTAVLSVDERDGMITHRVESELQAGDIVTGVVDLAPRFRKMQNHTAEHIVSGIIHRLFGYENVGFHLGCGYMTADFNGELTAEDIDRVESLANEAIFACKNVRAYYPDADELAAMQYRSKLELYENVRIVEIEDIDKCACCAPHVCNTGEIGICKIIDFIRYKGGMRLTMIAGFDALDDYRNRSCQIRHISMAISAKQSEVGEGVDRLIDEMGKLKGQISTLKREIMEHKLKNLDYTDDPIIIFEDTEDMLSARNFVNEAVKKTSRLCALFCGNDSEGYKYIIASNTLDLKAVSKDISCALNGRGGGSRQMIQGSCTADKKSVEAFLIRY